MKKSPKLLVELSRSWVLALCCLVVGVSVAFADGKVFAPVLVPQQVAMPDQRALLAWNEGVETLVIESAFVGKGTDFAWVVPLPGKPEVFPATPGTLPAAVALMQPVVEKGASELTALGILAGVVGILALALGWCRVDTLFRASVIGFLGALLGAVFGSFFGVAEWTWAIGALVAVWLAHRFILRPSRWLDLLWALLIVLLLAAVVIPTVGKVRSSAGLDVETFGNVTVERKIVGDFDVAVIAGREGAGVVGWLETNGFAMDAAARSVAEEHAASGGWFVASRVRREFSESGRSVPAPLAFRFKTERAVYPMRLTGAGAKADLEVELLVFGPSRAEAAGLAVRAVAPVEFADASDLAGRGRDLQPLDRRKVSHPELRRWAEGTAAATWLRGALRPAQMQADMFMTWGAGAEPVGLRAITEKDAWAKALALAGVVCLAGALVCGVVFPPGRPPLRWTVLILGLAAGAAGGLRATTTTVKVMRADGGIPWYALDEVSYMATRSLVELAPGTGDVEVKAAFAKELEKFSRDYGWSNRIGDAPGEIELQKVEDGRWRVVYYGAYGQASAARGYEVKVGEGRK